MKKMTKYSVLLGVFLIITGLAGIVWYWGFGIDEYRGTYDHASIIKMFDEDWAWLVQGNLITDVTDYSPEHTLEHRVRVDYDFETGNFYNIDLDIYVYRHLFKAVGFTAFGIRHPNTSRQNGFILFLGVDRDYRRHGYGRILLKYACDELFKRGCPYIELDTHIKNFSAQKLYTSAGFKEQSRANNIVYYRLMRPVLLR
jgi:ribosomal protein S18 acetylase RimI-like enzyme